MNRRKLFPIGRGLKQLSSFFTRFTSHWTGWSRCKETKQAAQGYLSGIVLPGKRKNMSGVARRIHLDLNVVQQFITDSPWDPQKVMATTIQTMSKATAKPEGVIIVDDTGQEKKGTKSPGVNRQVLRDSWQDRELSGFCRMLVQHPWGESECRCTVLASWFTVVYT